MTIETLHLKGHTRVYFASFSQFSKGYKTLYIDEFVFPRQTDFLSFLFGMKTVTPPMCDLG